MVYSILTLKGMAANHPLVSTRCELDIHLFKRARKSLIMHRIFRMKVCWYTFSAGKEKSEREKKERNIERKTLDQNHHALLHLRKNNCSDRYFSPESILCVCVCVCVCDFSISRTLRMYEMKL